MRWSRKFGADSVKPTIEWRSFDPAKIVHPTWLVEGLLPEHSTCCVYGAPNTGKSFLALDIALAVATGRQWLGLNTRVQAGKTKERGKIVYILAESPEGLNRRIAAWLEHHQSTRADGVEMLAEHFFIPIVENLRLDSEENLTELINQVRSQCPDVALIVFDPLVSFMDGDENSARDTQALINALRKLVETFAASHCSVLLVHHSGKEYSKGERGSSALRGGVDTLLRLEAGLLKVEKQRDAAKSPDIPLEFVTVVENIGDDHTRDLGKVVVKGVERPKKKAAPEHGRPEIAEGGRQDSSAANKPPRPKPPSPVQVRKNRRLAAVMAAMETLTQGQVDKTVSAAEVFAFIKKKAVSGSKTTFYDFMSSLAAPTNDGDALLVKDDTGQYKLARTAAPAGEH